MKALIKENNITLALALPIISGQLSQMLLGVIDTLMIGRLSTDDLAAAAFVNVLFNFPFVLGIGLFAAVSVVIAHEHGAERHSNAAESFRNGYLMSIVLGVLLALSLFAILPVLHWFQQPEIVTQKAPEYLIWMALSLIPMVPALTIKSFAEAKNHPWIVLWIMLAGVAVNILLNYLLIFGHWGFPPLGLKGAGIATFLARVGTLAGLWAYLRFSKDLAPSRPSVWLKPLDWKQCREIIQIGFPVSGQLSMEFGAFAVTALLIGQFGSTALASHQISLSCAAFAFMIPLGLSMATTIRIGHAYGAGQIERSKHIMIGAHGTTLFIMGLCALAFILYGKELAALFSTDPEVIALSAQLFIVVALFEVFDGAQVISMGALRGIRDVNIPTLIIFISFWVAGIPFGAWLAFQHDMGALGLWIGLATGLALAATVLTFRLFRLTHSTSCQ